MKIKLLVVLVVGAFIFVSCKNDHVCGPNYIPMGYPTYLSFGRDKISVEVDYSKITQTVWIPMVSQLADGREEFGDMDDVLLEIDRAKSTAIEGVHFLIDSTIRETFVDGKQVLDTIHKMWVRRDGGINYLMFNILPKNIKHNVKLRLIMLTRYGDPAIKETEIDLVLP